MTAKKQKAGIGDCQRACPCGLRFHHDDPCYSHVQGDVVTSCVCPDHPGECAASQG